MTSVDSASMTSVGLLPLIGRTALVELTKLDTGPATTMARAGTLRERP